MRNLERKARWKLRKARWRLRRRVVALQRLAARPVGAGSVAASLAAIPALALAVAVAGSAAGIPGSGISGSGGPAVAAPTASATAVTVGQGSLERYHALRLEAGRPWARAFDVPAELAALIHEIARSEGIEPELAFRLIRVESRFRGRAVGPRGAVGYTQVRPSTARWLDSTVTREKLFEAETNLRLGFRYLRLLLDRYNDTRLALLAYNRGPGTVAALLSVGQDPGNGYASRVLGTAPPPPSDSIVVAPPVAMGDPTTEETDGNEE